MNLFPDADGYQCWGLIICASLLSAWLTFAIASLLALLVQVSRECLIVFIHMLTLTSELIVAILAAVASGITIAMIVITAAGLASFMFPSSQIYWRVCLSAMASMSSLLASMYALFLFTPMPSNLELLGTMSMAASISLAIASSWATAIFSLVERETNHANAHKTRIISAVRNNRYLLLKILLKLPLNIVQEDLDLGLSLAVKEGHTEIGRVLLSAGANPNCRDSNQNTPLLIACDRGFYDFAKLLLDHKASSDATNETFSTPLHNAVKWGYAHCLKILLLENVNVNQTDRFLRTPLMLSAMFASDPSEIIDMLVEAGAEVNLIGYDHRTVLHCAAQRGICVEKLLQLGADDEIKDKDGNRPLHLAALGGHLECCKALLSNNMSNMRACNNAGQLPVHLAAFNGNTTLLDILIKKHTDVTTIDSTMRLPIHYASGHGHLNAVRLLVIRCSPLGSFTLDKQLIQCENPIVPAVQQGNMAVIRFFLSAGCNKGPVIEWIHDLDIVSFDLNKEENRLLHDDIYNPRKLMDLCRITIRLTIAGKCIHSVTKLPIPQIVKDYLDFQE